MSKEEGGVLQKEMPRTVTKYMGVCRVLFGVMVTLDGDGNKVGR